jgi:hypothetical protein
MNAFFQHFNKGAIFVAKNHLQCSDENLLNYLGTVPGIIFAGYPSGYPVIEVSGIRPSNPVSGRILYLKKGRIIRPGIRATGYPVHPQLFRC